VLAWVGFFVIFEIQSFDKGSFEPFMNHLTVRFSFSLEGKEK